MQPSSSAGAARRASARRRIAHLEERFRQISLALQHARRELQEWREEVSAASDGSDDSDWEVATAPAGATAAIDTEASPDDGRSCCVCFGSCDSFTRCGHPVCLVCLGRLRDRRCPMCRTGLDGEWHAPWWPSEAAPAGADPWDEGRPAAAGPAGIAQPSVEGSSQGGPAYHVEPPAPAPGQSLPPRSGIVLTPSTRELSRQIRRRHNLWLPQGWTVFTAESGALYYAHERLGAQWEPPEGTRPRR